MRIRPVEDKDLRAVDKLLEEVLGIHASIRPDLFQSGTKKYTDDELRAIFHDPKTPVFVAVDDNDEVLGYAFAAYMCAESNHLKARPYLYLDDLCVDEGARGQHVGKALVEYLFQYAKKNGCYEVVLNVWAGNDKARAFYDHMGFTVQKTCLEKIL